jgi:exonuclease SbcC
MGAISVENFQSHARSRLELHPGVNVVTGSSDSGKSALVRALVWLVKNRPQGFAFKSTFARRRDATLVRVEFADGTWVERERSGDENCYLMSGGAELEALRADVPDEVNKALTLEDYNVQGQHDGYFLLQSSAGEVARMLNEVVGLDVIDTTLKRVNSITADAKRDAERFSAEADEIYEVKLGEYDFIEGAELAVARTGGLVSERNSDLYREYQLQRLLAEWEEAERGLRQEADLAAMEGRLSALRAAAKSVNFVVINARLRAMRVVLDEYEAEEAYMKRLGAEECELSKEHNKMLQSVTECPACGGVVGDDGRGRLQEFFRSR